MEVRKIKNPKFKLAKVSTEIRQSNRSFEITDNGSIQEININKLLKADFDSNEASARSAYLK